MNATRRLAPWMAPLLLAPALVTCGGTERAVGPAFSQFGTSTQLAFLNQPANVAVLANEPPIGVAIQDAQGLTVTTSAATVTVAITPGTGTAGAVLSGRLTRTALNGVVYFEGLKVDRAGTGYTLTMTSPGLNSAVSLPFDVGSGTVGPATKLGVVTQPSAVAAGAAISPAVRIAVQDANGNTVTTSTANVTVAITGGTGTAGAALGGTLTQAAVAGVATFNNLTLDKSGTGYTLTSTSTGLTSVVTGAFAVTAGAPAALAVSTQPGTVAAGSSIAPAVQVSVKDAFGNTVTGSGASIALAITGGTGTAGAVLGGTLSQPAVNGVATFGNLTIDKAGTGYTLTAASSGLTGAVSAAFDVTSGSAARLVFTNQPSDVASGAAIAPAVRVTVQDAQGNVVTGSTATIALAITGGTGAAGAILGGALQQPAVNGVATFSNLSIDKAGAGYTLSATSSGLGSAISGAFNVSAGAASRLAFSTQPVNTAAGAAVIPAVQVTVQDNNGNTITGSSASISVAITAGTGAIGAVLGGTLTQSAVNGVATFAGLTVNLTGSGYRLDAASGGLAGATSNAFDIGVGAATSLAFTVQPSNAAAGSAVAPAVRVTVQDAQGNTVSNSSASITLSITPGTGSAGAVLGGTVTATAVGGVAIFNNVSVNKVGSGYTLTATSAGLSPASSGAFDISAGAAAKLVYLVQPSNAQSLVAIGPAVQVTVQDAQGNVVTASTAAVTLAIPPGMGTAGAVLGGTLSQSAVNGVATFSDLSIDKAGTGYALAATSPGLTGATSTAFNISAGPAAKLAWIIQPSAVVAGAAITPAVQVAVQDAQGNLVTGNPANITLSITPGTGTPGAALGGTVSLLTLNGIATFSPLTVSLPGTGYTLAANATSLAGAVSSAFNVAATATLTLVPTSGPSTGLAGKRLFPFFFAVKDAQGNTVTTFNGSGTASLTPGTGTPGAVLSGALTHAITNGVLIVEGLSLDKVGTGYTIAVTAAGVANGTSAPFSITPNVAARLVVSAQPSNVAVASAITPPVQVTVQDAFGNTVTTSNAGVTMAITAGTGTAGAVLGGTLTQAAVNGVASFANLTVDRAGTGYTLTGTAALLSSATTTAFAVSALPATKLAFTVQPSAVVAGVAIAPAVRVTVQDVNGNTVTGSTAPVTLAITPGTGTAGAVLGGTLTQNAVNGVATFANITVNLAGAGYTLGATSPGLAGAVSAAFTVSSASTFTIQKFLGDNQTALVGFATNIRPAVRILNGATPVPNVAVTFAVTGGGGSVTGGTVVNTNANGVAQVGSWVVGAGAGPNALTATGAGSYAGSNNVTFAATGQTAQYHVEVRNIGPAFSPAVAAAFAAAAAHWEQVIYGDQPDIVINTSNACGLGVTINQLVDDVIILAKFDSIDGPGQILGSAGACSIRTSNGLAIYGVMQFDTADVAGLIASNSLNPVILHEMGHVLGFSSGIWNTQAGITQQRICAQSLTSGNPPSVTHPDTHFDCTQGGATNFARAAFDSLGGSSYTGGLKVPLENCTGGTPPSCGSGTYNSHWRESAFGNELMTGYLNSGANPFSLVTIASFQDEGYLVNYAAAEVYSHVFTVPAVSRGVPIDLGNDLFRVPIDVVDDRTGVVTRVIQPQP